MDQGLHDHRDMWDGGERSGDSRDRTIDRSGSSYYDRSKEADSETHLKSGRVVVANSRRDSSRGEDASGGGAGGGRREVVLSGSHGQLSSSSSPSAEWLLSTTIQVQSTAGNTSADQT